tara:strand:+ start:228 stop:542 length:315 start_codon:yes stop_codon:yes gene_type:complete
MLSVYQLEWNGPTILDNIGDGLWCNNTKLAIHLPILKKKFEIINEYKETALETYCEKFYVEYPRDNCLERMKLSYIALNDLVFNCSVYSGLDKNKFYTTMELKN